MSHFLEPILSAPPWIVLLVVGTVVFCEDAIFVGFVVPGETAAVLGGVVANQGRVPLAAMLAVVIGCAIIGDTVGYEIGRHVGPRVLAAKIFDRKRDELDRAQDFLARRGGAAVFLGRWIAFFRAVMPALAGTARMRYRTFLLFNALGGITWGAVVVSIGYAAGASYAKVEKTFGTGSAIAVAAIVVAVFVIWRIRKHRSQRAHGVEHHSTSSTAPDRSDD
ncbi:MAG TPA: DedA family protein [Segeticoccus sp.]|uniref:DedA family protein n=1 Tax=Segeticoccus sp. TaxID=2706531 RepID=UPI002D803857|nr:DedA family protein [Segeticoccus sp.]HET8598715.1 DedA family protein [Segeticoccus sp.]